MAVSLYFGLPGCGKTTFLAMFALKAVKQGKYDFVFTNVHLNIPGVTYIDNDCIGKYELANCLLLIDEATLFADSRDYKKFDKGKLAYFLEHRHRYADIMLFTQQWDGVDKKIRVITDRVYYIYKGVFTGHWFSSCYRIPYHIIIPEAKKGAENGGDIVQGYVRPPFYLRLFGRRIYRPNFYRYFDSWELDPLPALPSEYTPVTEDEFDKPIAWRWYKKTRRFMNAARMKSRKERYARFFKRFLFR